MVLGTPFAISHAADSIPAPYAELLEDYQVEEHRQLPRRSQHISHPPNRYAPSWREKDVVTVVEHEQLCVQVSFPLCVYTSFDNLDCL